MISRIQTPFATQWICGRRFHLQWILDRIITLCQPWHRSCVTRSMILDINWWLDFMSKMNGRTYGGPPPSHTSVSRRMLCSCRGVLRGRLQNIHPDKAAKLRTSIPYGIRTFSQRTFSQRTFSQRTVSQRTFNQRTFSQYLQGDI